MKLVIVENDDLRRLCEIACDQKTDIPQAAVDVCKVFFIKRWAPPRSRVTTGSKVSSGN